MRELLPFHKPENSNLSLQERIDLLQESLKEDAAIKLRAANYLVLYATSEKIAKACNDSAANGFYLSTDEAQHRFMMAYNYGIEDLDLWHPHFWDLFWFVVDRRK